MTLHFIGSSICNIKQAMSVKVNKNQSSSHQATRPNAISHGNEKGFNQPPDDAASVVLLISIVSTFTQLDIGINCLG